MLISQRAQRIQPSPTLAMNAKAKALAAQGHSIINLSVGEPDFDTPAAVCEAAIAAIHQGQTRYTAEDGSPALKQAIIAKFQRDQGLCYEASEILASAGAKQSLYNIIQAMVNAGDEVIIPAPYWVSYPDMVKLADGQPRIVPTSLAQNFKISPEQLAAAITPKTKLLILNSPSNPTGVCYTAAELRALAKVLLAHPQVYILSDDIYEKLLWSPEPFSNLLMACPELKSRCFLINGASKAYAMTGWRLGYMAGPKDLIAEAKKIQSQSTSNPCSISQAATVAALEGDQSGIQHMVGEFRRRHDYLVQALGKIPGFELLPAEGAFYCFPKIEGLMQRLEMPDDLALCDYLLSHSHIATVPGSAFGSPGYLRLSFAVSMPNLEEAVSRLQKL